MANSALSNLMAKKLDIPGLLQGMGIDVDAMQGEFKGAIQALQARLDSIDSQLEEMRKSLTVILERTKKED